MGKKAVLTKRELTSCLKQYDGWTLNKQETKISKKFSFHTYVDALVFIARVAVHAEILNHHPDIEFTYKKVKVTLTTHALKALSKVDLALLERIERLHSNTK